MRTYIRYANKTMIILNWRGPGVYVLSEHAAGLTLWPAPPLAVLEKMTPRYLWAIEAPQDAGFEESKRGTHERSTESAGTYLRVGAQLECATLPDVA